MSERRKESMLTTIDNPFNPFVQWDEWYTYDESKGYHTSQLLALEAKTSTELSDEENAEKIEEAIDFILSINASGMHKRIYKD